MAESPLDAADADWDRTWETTLRVNVLAAASLMRQAVPTSRNVAAAFS